MSFRNSIRHRLMLDAVNAKHCLGSLLPARSNVWWPIVEDIFSPTACEDLRASLLNKGIAHDECSCISVDGTFKVCMPVLGQGKLSDPASLRATFPFRDENAYRRVITLRGRAGAVLGLEPAPGEHGERIAACLVQALPAAGLLQVQHVATDSPGHKLLQDLRECCPNLEALSLDPTHTAMRYEQATGGRKTAGSVLVRRLMMKFTSFDASITSNIWGPFFDGSAAVVCSAQEATLRQHILNRSLAKARARRVIDASLTLKTWPVAHQAAVR